MRRLAALVIAFVAAACDGAPGPHAGAPRPPGSPSPAPSTVVSASNPMVHLEGYPLSRLNVSHNPLEPLPRELDRAALDALSVRSFRAYSATSPRVWLFVFELPTQAALLDARPKIEAMFRDDEPPYSIKTAYTGSWLLVTGFPSSKPVSPEMEAAREVFLSRWAGEE